MLQWGIAAVLFVVIGLAGLLLLRAIANMRPKERVDPEDVASFAVSFVCGECGTEYQVTRLGEMQVPRHCGEPMKAVRRLGQQAQNN